MLQIACRAIATHHDENNNDILKDDLARLLFISDNIQNWGRPFIHREPGLKDGSRKLMPVIGCKKMVLKSEKGAYRAQFWMDTSQTKMELLRDVYGWNFNEFKVPGDRVRELLDIDDLCPSMILTEKECIFPKNFRSFMGLN